MGEPLDSTMVFNAVATEGPPSSAMLSSGSMGDSGARRLSRVQYRERLTVPPAWWLLALGLAASLAVALGYYLGWVWAGAAGLIAMGVAVGIFASAATTIAVTPDRLLIGRAEIDHRYIGACRALDAEETRRRSGVEADARAHLVLRPYLPLAVEITLADPADPVPYWLVSSRHPSALADAIESARHEQPRTTA